MKINLNKSNSLILYKRYKGIQVSINDNKQLITLFADNYIKFLSRIRGTNINNKNDLIEVLNRKPRSFLTRLRILVSKFKHYENLVNKNISSKIINPKLIVKATKDLRQPLNINPSLTLKSKPLNSITNNTLIDAKSEILKQKISLLKNMLKNNELTLPLNLLTPLLKLKQNNISISQVPNSTQLQLISYLETFILSGKFILNKELQHWISDKTKTEFIIILEYLHKLITLRHPWFSMDLLEFKQKYIQIYDQFTTTTRQTNKFKDLIKDYHENQIKTINATQYFELINRYKIVDPFHQNINYNYNKSNNTKIQNIFTLLEYAFKSMSCLISKPVFMETQDNLIINLFYFFIPGKMNKIKRFNRYPFGLGQGGDKLPIATSLNGISIPNNNNNLNIKNNKESNDSLTFKQILTPYNINILNKLCTILSNIFKKPVKLDLIALRQPFYDDNILVKAIGIMSKRIPVASIFDYIYRNTELYSKFKANDQYRYTITRSFLAGIKIKIGGRLMTQKVIPKISSRTMQRGATATGKVSFVDWSRVNLKNKRGSHSITVKMSHVI